MRLKLAPSQGSPVYKSGDTYCQSPTSFIQEDAVPISSNLESSYDAVDFLW